jgi:hypothetical protein
VHAFADEIDARGKRTKATPKAKAIRSFIGVQPDWSQEERGWAHQENMP